MTRASQHRIVGGLLFGGVVSVYSLSMYPTVGYWTSAEWSTAVASMGVAHAPGAPVVLLIDRVLSQLPLPGEFAWRVNLASAFIAGAVVWMTYAIAGRLTSAMFRSSRHEHWLSVIAGVIASLSLAFASSFWENTQQSAWDNAALLFLAATLLAAILVLESEKFNARWLLLIAFLLGLSSSIQPSVVLMIIPVGIAVFGRFSRHTFGYMLGFSVVVLVGLLAMVYLPSALLTLGTELFADAPAYIVLPSLLGAAMSILLLLALVLSFTPAGKAAIIFTTMLVFFLLGFSVQTVIPVRAASRPVFDTGSASDMKHFAAYLREASSNASILDRRWKEDPASQAEYRRYESDFDFLWNHHIQNGFIRSLLWNFVGRSSDADDAQPTFLALTDSPNLSPDGQSAAFPQRYYGLPFLFGIIGLMAHWKKQPRHAGLLATVFLVLSVGIILLENDGGVPGHGMDGQFVGAFLVFACWIGMGAAWVIRSFVAERHGIVGGTVAAIIVLLVLLPGNLFHTNLRAHNRSSDFSARDLAYNMLQSCDANAILFTQGDNDLFPLLYVQSVLGVRADVRVVNLGLLGTGWYGRQNMDRPLLAANPVRTSFRPEEMERLARMDREALRKTAIAAEQKTMRIPVSDEDGKRFLLERREGIPRPLSDTLAPRRVPRAMEYVVKARGPVALDDEGKTIRYYRPWREILMDDILHHAAWKRPVSFSILCPVEVFDGFEDYLRMDGLVLTVTPLRIADGSSIRYGAMRKHLLYRTDHPHATATRGFLLAALESPHTYVSREARSLIATYRNLFIHLAGFAQHVLHDDAETIRVLNVMEQTFPETRFPMDYRYAFDRALLYREAGETAVYRSQFRVIEQKCWAEINRNPAQNPTIYSPYRYLLDMYQMEKDWRRALEVLALMQKQFPEAADIQTKREEILTLTRIGN